MVARNAPQEVINAAYRVLAKRFHPDTNGGDARAERVMRIVNTSYAVLSDPEQRRLHDEWIEQNEVADEGDFVPPPSPPPIRRSADSQSAVKNHLKGFWPAYLLGAILIWLYVADQAPPAPSGLGTYDPSPSERETNSTDVVNATTSVPPEVAAYMRPQKAPNGSPWPTTAAYIAGYKRLRTDGLSKLTIDNSQRSSDVFVKLVAIDAGKTMPIRHAYIPAYQTFTMNSIRAGNYDVRYMDLDDGGLARSEAFNLQQINDGLSVKSSVVTMTLFKVSNGNMQTYPLNPSEF